MLDPMGNTIGHSDVYGTAKDGQAWALAKGSWRWTTQLTPTAANVVKAPPASKTKAKTAAKKSTTSVKGSNTGKTAAAASANSTSSGFDDIASTTAIHPWTLAAVAVLAVAYGVYEYRQDLANRFYQLRRHRATGRAAG